MHAAAMKNYTSLSRHYDDHHSDGLHEDTFKPKERLYFLSAASPSVLASSSDLSEIVGRNVADQAKQKKFKQRLRAKLGK